MNRYLVHIEAVTEVDAIDESDAKNQVMCNLEALTYHFPRIERLGDYEVKTPKELPKVTVGKKTYYFDERLGQLRNIDNPHDYINL